MNNFIAQGGDVLQGNEVMYLIDLKSLLFNAYKHFLAVQLFYDVT